MYLTKSLGDTWRMLFYEISSYHFCLYSSLRVRDCLFSPARLCSVFEVVEDLLCKTSYVQNSTLLMDLLCVFSSISMHV